MAVNIHTAPPGQAGIHITSETVAGMLSDRSKMSAEITRLMQERAELDDKLDAVRVLAPNLFPTKPSEVDLMRMVAVKAEPEERGSATLVEAVIKAVNAAADRLTPAEVRAAVEAQGDGGLMTSHNYLYTAIKRAADQGKITKFGDRYGKSLAAVAAELFET